MCDEISSSTSARTRKFETPARPPGRPPARRPTWQHARACKHAHGHAHRVEGHGARCWREHARRRTLLRPRLHTRGLPRVLHSHRRRGSGIAISASQASAASSVNPSWRLAGSEDGCYFSEVSAAAVSSRPSGLSASSASLRSLNTQRPASGASGGVAIAIAITGVGPCPAPALVQPDFGRTRSLEALNLDDHMRRFGGQLLAHALSGPDARRKQGMPYMSPRNSAQ